MVDHVQALRGDASRFWDGPFQALCRGCHDSRKKAQDARGYDTAVGLDGFPLDEAHPFYTGKLRRSPR
jgi:hypothetical protein